MPFIEGGNELNDFSRRDRAHDSKLKRHSFQLRQILGQALGLHGSLVNVLQMRTDHLAKIRQMGEMPLTVEKGATKLSFQLLNGTGQRGL